MTSSDVIIYYTTVSCVEINALKIPQHFKANLKPLVFCTIKIFFVSEGFKSLWHLMITSRHISLHFYCSRSVRRILATCPDNHFHTCSELMCTWSLTTARISFLWIVANWSLVVIFWSNLVVEQSFMYWSCGVTHFFPFLYASDTTNWVITNCFREPRTVNLSLILTDNVQLCLEK